jgi:O-antigen/teichoic acid export membrane protein
MKLNRTKNAVRNSFYGGINFVYTTIAPFIMRTLMLYYLGVEYTGLNGLFASILQVLNLTELGVGSAMNYSMYRAIADDDEARICALMKLYRKYYRIIGCVVAAIGLIILPFVPKLIKGSVPEDLNVFILYLLNLSTTVLSYFLFAYRNCLVASFQRNDINSKVTMSVNTVTYILQAIVLVFFRNYYIYLILSLLSQIFVNICTAYITTKMFPKYHPVGELSKDTIAAINRRVKDVFTAKFSTVVMNSSDPIIISTFLGLTALAMYQNYYYIVHALAALVSVILTSVMAGFGNSLLTETAEKNIRDLKIFTMMIMWLSSIFVVGILTCIQPVMDIWVGPDLKFSFGIVICFCIYFYNSIALRLFNMYKDAAGIWTYDKWRPMVSALVNLVLNLLTVQFLGIYGIILSTVVAHIFVSIPWILRNLFKYVFEPKAFGDYAKRIIFYFADAIVISFIAWVICDKIVLTPWLTFLVRGAVCVIVSNVLLLITYRMLPEFADCKELFIKLISKGSKKLKKNA